jgi:hypothetical protein
MLSRAGRLNKEKQGDEYRPGLESVVPHFRLFSNMRPSRTPSVLCGVLTADQSVIMQEKRWSSCRP